MNLKEILGFALFALCAFFAFQAVSGIWAFASSAIFPQEKASPEEKVFVSSITVNSMAPQSVLNLNDAGDSPAAAANVPSERKQKILGLEDRVQVYSSLFDSASLLEMDEYEAGSVN